MEISLGELAKQSTVESAKEIGVVQSDVIKKQNSIEKVKDAYESNRPSESEELPYDSEFKELGNGESERPIEDCELPKENDNNRQLEIVQESWETNVENRDCNNLDTESTDYNRNEGNDSYEDDSENDKMETRKLTDEEKQDLKDRLGWSDDKINNNCEIDKDNVIHYKTDCQDKEGQMSDCGVLYARKRFEYNGVVIEGVFPEFDSVFDTELAKGDYLASNTKQFSECNKKLKEAVENNPDLKKQFTESQLEDIENGRTPRGYTWHHNEKPGKMQLVKTEDHDRRIGGAAHTGGNSIWGNSSIEKTTGNEKQKGETF